MPKFDRDTVRELVLENGIVGITFDTNVVDSFARNGNLRHPMLRALASLTDKKVTIVVSDVVAREIQSHFVSGMMETYRGAKASLAKLGRVAGGTKEMVAAAAAALPDEDSQTNSLHGEFNAFLEMLKASVVKADDYAKFSAILDLYFEGKPPFANAKKKAEFPDAIAIASLQGWSDDYGDLIAISNDGDWVSTFEKSKNVYVVQDLHTALAIFQEDDKLAEAFSEAYRNGNNALLAKIREAIGESLADLDLDLDFSTDWRVDIEPTDASLVSVAAPENLDAVEIIGRDLETLTLSIPVAAKVMVTAHASFMVTDPIDHDEVTIGSHQLSTEVEHEYAVTITLYAHGDTTIEVLEASVIPDTRLTYVDFDYVGFSPDPSFYTDDE